MWVVFWDWALTLWDLMLTPGGQCPNWTERYDSQLVSESWRSNAGKDTTHSVSDALWGITVHSQQRGILRSHRHWGQPTQSRAASPALPFWKPLILALRYQVALLLFLLHTTDAIPPSTLAKVLLSTLAIPWREKEEKQRKQGWGQREEADEVREREGEKKAGLFGSGSVHCEHIRYLSKGW